MMVIFLYAVVALGRFFSACPANAHNKKAQSAGSLTRATNCAFNWQVHALPVQAARASCSNRSVFNLYRIEYGNLEPLNRDGWIEQVRRKEIAH